MPPSYALSINLHNRLCVVIGGGRVAERKVKGLLEAEAFVRVVSPTITPYLQEVALSHKNTEYLPKTYEISSLMGATLVFATTDIREVNTQVSKDCHALKILCNRTDAPEKGDFIIPATLRRGDLSLSISTGGNLPLLASSLRNELENRFVEHYGEYVALLGEMRTIILQTTQDEALRRKAMLKLVEEPSGAITVTLRWCVTPKPVCGFTMCEYLFPFISTY